MTLLEASHELCENSENWPLCALRSAEMYGSTPTVVRVLREMSLPVVGEVSENFFVNQARQLKHLCETISDIQPPQGVWGEPNKKRNLAKLQFRYDFGAVLRDDDSIKRNVEQALSETVSQLYPMVFKTQKALSCQNHEISDLRRELVELKQENMTRFEEIVRIQTNYDESKKNLATAYELNDTYLKGFGEVRQENKTLLHDLSVARDATVAAQREANTYMGKALTSAPKLQTKTPKLDESREQSPAAANAKQEICQLRSDCDEAKNACHVLVAVSSVLNQEMLRLRDGNDSAEDTISELRAELAAVKISLETALASGQEEKQLREENLRLNNSLRGIERDLLDFRAKANWY